MKGLYDKLVNNKVLRPVAIFVYIFIKRALPIAFFALLLGVGAVMIDRHNIREAPGEQFVNYYAFDVANAREGEDVYFNVCRRHQENYNFTGNLTVYVYRNADPKAQPIQVHGQDIKGNIRNDCENKVLRAADFNHTPGTYKMAFCVNFNVKYDEPKTVCKESNIYKIYSQPADITSRINFYEEQIQNLQQQLDGANVGQVQQGTDNTYSASPTDIATGRTITGQEPANQPAPQQPVSNVPQQPTTPAAPVRTCAVNLLGLIPLFCRTDTPQ